MQHSGQQVRAGDLPGLAERLRRDCQKLADFLAEAEAGSLESLEDDLTAGLAQIESLRRDVSEAVAALLLARQDVSSLRPSSHQALGADVEQAARLLRQAEASYRGLSAKVSTSLTDVGQKLQGIQRGGRVLRSYRGAARSDGPTPGP